MAVIGLGGTLAVTAASTLAAVTATFGISLWRKRFDTVDTFWGLGFALVAVLGFALGDGALPLRLTVTVLTVVWGVRLAVHLHLRNHGGAEDARYAAMAGRGRARMFVTVYLVQAVVLWFVSLPVQFAQFGHGFGATAWIGVAVWLLGFVFETVGDAQLRRFRGDPAKAGRVLDTGLWRYSRHPNYFGDACVWWGLYLLAYSDWIGAATLLSPLAMTYTLARGTGKPLLEKSLRSSRPGYAAYVERTSGFVPLPPRSSATRPSDRR